MKDDKLEKVNNVKNFLEKNNVFFDEKPNGQLIIGTVSLYATTETWYESNTGIKGKGVNSCLAFLRNNNLI